MNIQLGYWRWRIYRWHEHPDPFRGRYDLALAWVRSFSATPAAMFELREILNRAHYSPKSRSDAEVVEEVAQRLSSGEFHVCGEYCGPVLSQPVDFAVAEDEIPAELLKRKPPPPKKAPPVEEAAATPAAAPAEDDPLEEVDAEAVAQTLTAAAVDGSPFCEECAKAELKVKIKVKGRFGPGKTETATAPKDPFKALAEEAPPVAPVPLPLASPGAIEAPEHVDAEAIATALQEAAREGAPFCVECAKAAEMVAARGSLRGVGRAALSGRVKQAEQLPASRDPQRQQRDHEMDYWLIGATTSEPVRVLAGPIPPGATFPVNLDGEAVARSLKDASAEGIPFCAECLKAALAHQS